MNYLVQKCHRKYKRFEIYLKFAKKYAIKYLTDHNSLYI